MANTLGFQLYSLKDYEGGWAAAFDAVKGLGIDTIEAWCGAVPADAAGATSTRLYQLAATWPSPGQTRLSPAANHHRRRALAVLMSVIDSSCRSVPSGQA